VSDLPVKADEMPVFPARSRRLTPKIKIQILTLVLYEGVTITDCAAYYGVSRGHLSRVVNAFRRQYCPTEDITALTEQLVPKCIEAIMKALNDSKNPYRAAAIAFKVAKELGLYKNH
jgi:hypothetical protein